MKYKTGLIRSPQPPKLRFGAYFMPSLLPPVPAVFGHQDLFPKRGWGMLANGGRGAVSDCTVAGGMHVCALWRKVVNKPVRFTDADAKQDYFAITHGEDSGADLTTMSKYWRDIGFRDSKNIRHKILAYMHTDPTNLEHVDAACWLFDAVGLGIKIGDAEMEAFDREQPWDNPNWPSDYYHYVPMVGKDTNYRHCVTWGGSQPFTEAWYKAKCEEVVPFLSDENLLNGKSLEGFDVDALEADLEHIGEA